MLVQSILIQSVNLTAILTTLRFQFDSYFNLTAILTTLRSNFTDHFQQDKFKTFKLLTRFQSYNTVTVRNLRSQ